MNLLTVSLGTFVDRALAELQAPSEVGLQTVLSGPLAQDAATMVLADASSVNVSDIVELDSELVLVTGKTSDATPTLTVSRGYYKSARSAHDAGTVVTVNPAYARVRVADAVRRAFPSLEALGLPLVKAMVLNRAPGMKHAELTEDVREILRVSYVTAVDGAWRDLAGWTFLDGAPTATYATGKLLSLPRAVSDDVDLQVTARVPYRWSTHPLPPDEEATIQIMEGAEDLPSKYAASWIVSRREISRSQLNRAEEWNQGEPMRGGVSATLVRVLWQEFYRALDEVRRLPVIPLHRPYVPMPRI